MQNMIIPAAKEKRLAALVEGFRFGEIIKHFAEQNGEDQHKLIEAARRIHHKDGSVEIDSDSICSGSDDDGDYVLAWVWVSNIDAGLPSQVCQTCWLDLDEDGKCDFCESQAAGAVECPD